MDFSIFAVESNCLGAVENTVFLGPRVGKLLRNLKII